MRIFMSATAAVALLGAASSAAAGNLSTLVQNGDFTATGSTPAANGGSGAAGEFITDGGYNAAYDVSIPGWSTETSTNSDAPFIFVQTATAIGNGAGPSGGGASGSGFPDSWDNGYRQLWGSITAPPIGGPNAVVLDADYHISPLWQAIPTADLVAGETYSVTFAWSQAQWAQNSGDTTSGLEVAFGGQILQVTPGAPPNGYGSDAANQTVLPSETWSGWQVFTGSFTYEPGTTVITYGLDEGSPTFTADNNWLTFIAEGTPQGEPPTILISGVSLVPEPATWALSIVGIGMVGATARRRRQAAV